MSNIRLLKGDCIKQLKVLKDLWVKAGMIVV